MIAEPEIFIVGVNVDKWTVKRRHAAGSIRRVAEGVYLRADLDARQSAAALAEHAIRIAYQLYPSAALAGATAYRQRAIDGAVCLATTSFYGLDKRLRSIDGTLHLYRQKFDPPPGVAMNYTLIRDSIGEFRMSVVPDDILILDHFVKMPEGAPSARKMGPDELLQVVERRLRTIGSTDALRNRLIDVGERLGWVAPVKGALALLSSQYSASEPKKLLAEYTVFWYDRPVAGLAHDGVAWVFDYNPTFPLNLSEFAGKAPVPSFIGSLMPERMADQSEPVVDSLKELSVAERYCSNITIRPKGRGVDGIIIDALQGSLVHFTDPETIVFKGVVDENVMACVNTGPAAAHALAGKEMPRIAGAQHKIPVCLTADGRLELAKGRPFTHILKTAYSSSHMSTIGANEWLTMYLAACAKISTERFALVDFGHDWPPGFLAERFDVRANISESSFYLVEDMWSAMGCKNAKDKFDAELCHGASAVAGRLMDISSAPSADAKQFLKQVMFSWLIGNGDLHLKNISILKVASHDLKRFEHKRLSPAYDMLCTAIYPAQSKTAALLINGKRKYGLDQFRALGERMGIGRDEVDTELNALILDCNFYLDRLLANLPAPIKAFNQCAQDFARIKTILDERTFALYKEFSDEAAAGGCTERFSFKV